MTAYRLRPPGGGTVYVFDAELVPPMLRKLGTLTEVSTVETPTATRTPAPRLAGEVFSPVAVGIPPAGSDPRTPTRVEPA